jgi:hypothetical protein
VPVQWLYFGSIWLRFAGGQTALAFASRARLLVCKAGQVFDLPEQLPSGRFLPHGSPTLWQSDGPVPDPLGVWSRCERAAAATGIWPVLSGWPVDPWSPHDPAEIAAVDVPGELERNWRALREDQLSVGDDYPVDDRGEAVSGPGQWPPYDQWPGLAPAVPDRGADQHDEAHLLVLEHLLRDPRGIRGAYLTLVPAQRSSDIPAVMGWQAEAPVVELSAMLRSGEDRFGARVVAFQGASLYVSVARPPTSADHASLLALEHILTGADNLNSGGPFAEYADSLVGAQLWTFWWD